jgi:hypothetical protein
VTQRPCWSNIEVGRILKPDAEEIADHIFDAVHCTTSLQVADTSDGDRISTSPESLIEGFLDSRRDYVQAVVLGESGTGKSHLIQWMRLHIPQDDSTVLLTIPKTGTSLRGIVDRLIARLPLDERGTYEDRLRQAGTQTTSQAAKVSKFLDSLAWAIEHGGLASDPVDIDLSTLLPDVLRDPNFRNGFFLVPGSTVGAIVQHVFIDPDNRDGSAERREFGLGDLPLDGRSYNDASRRAKEAIDYIKGEEGMDARSIALMNLNLDAAIAQTLNFSADNLIELMNALRRHLAIQGKRLILLIEDFARLQGIDTALLQALITPPGQGDDRLCELRWAMAVTTGYFRRLEQTVRSRATFVVDMDMSKPASLPRLTAGYLNALRLGDNKLKVPHSLNGVPSNCTDCEIRASCFKAFGVIDGIGLFPFTEQAINVMAGRTESLTAEGNFNPRRYLRSVLESVLWHHYEDLEHGEFPPDALLKRIGGSNALKPIDRQKLEQSDGTHFARHNVLLELWDGTGRIVNLPKGIHEAFGIPELHDVAISVAIIGANPKTQPPPPKISQGTPLLAPEIADLRRWASDNALLSQTLVTELRQLVFSALESYIDWDKLGYKKATVASPTGTVAVPFRQVSINFKFQQTQQQSSLVTLEVSSDAALALEALLMNKHQGNWDFPDSGQLLANLLETLRVWGASIEGQLKNIYGGNKDWNPAIAAVELLVISVHQGRRITIGDSDLVTLVSRMWESSAPNSMKCIHRPFSDLNTRLVSYWPKLLDILRNLSSGTKGGVAGNYLRIAPILRTVRAFRLRSLQLNQAPPSESPSKELKELADIYRRTQSDLPNLLAEEKQAWSTWLLTIHESIPAEISISVLVVSLKAAIDDVVNQGINAGASRGRLEEILNSINPVNLDRTLNHVRALKDANTADSLIRLSSIGESREAIDNLLTCADTFLQTSDAATSNERSRLEQQSSAGLRESELRIESSLEKLARSLDEIMLLPGEGA